MRLRPRRMHPCGIAPEQRAHRAPVEPPGHLAGAGVADLAEVEPGEASGDAGDGMLMDGQLLGDGGPALARRTERGGVDEEEPIEEVLEPERRLGTEGTLPESPDGAPVAAHEGGELGDGADG
jgi:hypothetical protein